MSEDIIQVLTKLAEVDTKLDIYTQHHSQQLEKIETDVKEVKEKITHVEKVQDDCPVYDLESNFDVFKTKMSIWLFLIQHWKWVAVFLGLILGSYSLIVAAAGLFFQTNGG